MMDKIKIFVSYSHQNSDWVSKEGKYKLIPWLEKQLEEVAVIWTDHALKQLIGEEYTKMIKQEIMNADIAMLLISQDFVSSHFITEFELPFIQEQYKKGQMKIIPLHITNLSAMGKEKIAWIFDLQTYPSDTKPLIKFFSDDAEWEDAKIDILNGIENKIGEIQKNKAILTQPKIINNPNKIEEIQKNKTRPTVKKEENSVIVFADKKIISPLDVEFTSFTEMVGGVPIEMVAIEGGTFSMDSNSSDDYYEQTPLRLSDFFIGKYQVTFAQYDAYCKATGSAKPSDADWGRGNRPVINVSWNDAVAYCNWLSRQTGKKYRLPTEAEWEYAAMGGQDNTYSGSNNIKEVGWYLENSDWHTHEVGQKRANGYGLYDMSGNVWEWCNDQYTDSCYSNSPPENPTGICSDADRVLRGGSWNYNANYCRVSDRYGYAPDNRISNFGFRIIQSL